MRYLNKIYSLRFDSIRKSLFNYITLFLRFFLRSNIEYQIDVAHLNASATIMTLIFNQIASFLNS